MPPPALTGDRSPELTAQKANLAEFEKEKQTVDSNDPSMVSSTLNGAEKPETPEDEGTTTEKKGPDPSPVEYPKGVELFCIMLALVLSITLCSLDQVSTPSLSFSSSRLFSMHQILVR